MNILPKYMHGMSMAAGSALLVALAPPSVASAQTHVSNVRLRGFKVGVATSSTKPADLTGVTDGETVTGLSAGIFGRIPLGSSTAVQGELLFVRQGTDSGDLELRSSVLRVPISLQVLIPTKGIGLRAYGGATLDLPLSCSPDGSTIELDFFGTPVQETFEGCPIEDSEFRTGLIGGALVDFALGGSILTLDLRYNHGLSRVKGRTREGFFATAVFPDLQGFRGFELTLGVGIR